MFAAGRRGDPDRARHLATRAQGLEGKPDRDLERAACARRRRICRRATSWRDAARRAKRNFAASRFRPNSSTAKRRWSTRPARRCARRQGAGLLGVRAGAACRRQHRAGQSRLRAVDRKDPATRAEGTPHGSVEIVGVMRWPEKRGLVHAGRRSRRAMSGTCAIPMRSPQRRNGLTAAPFYIDQEAPVPPGGPAEAGQARGAICATIILQYASPGSASRLRLPASSWRGSRAGSLGAIEHFL